jgi:hypothetical protein
MTAREKILWLIVGGVTVIALIYNFALRNSGWLAAKPDSRPAIGEARRVLRAERNIIKRQQAVAERLNQLERRFYRENRAGQAELELLEVVEDMAFKCGLPIQLKNMAPVSKGELGVSLEGSASSEQVCRFLQQLTVAPVELKVKRLRLHAVPEKELLNYQKNGSGYSPIPLCHTAKRGDVLRKSPGTTAG